MDLAGLQPWHLIAAFFALVVLVIGVVLLIARAQTPKGQPMFGKDAGDGRPVGDAGARNPHDINTGSGGPPSLE